MNMNHQVTSLAEGRFPTHMRTRDAYEAYHHAHHRVPGVGSSTYPMFPHTLNNDNHITNTIDLEFFSSDDDGTSISQTLNDVRHISQGINFQRKKQQQMMEYNSTMPRESNDAKFSFWGLINSKSKSAIHLPIYGGASSTQATHPCDTNHIRSNSKYLGNILKGGEPTSAVIETIYCTDQTNGDTLINRDGTTNTNIIQHNGNDGGPSNSKRGNTYRDVNTHHQVYNDDGDTRLREKQRMQLRVVPVNEIPAFQHHYHDRDPDRDYTASHKLITNFPFHPITVADRKHLFYNPSRPALHHPEGSWGAAIDGQQSLSRGQRVFSKGVVDIHDFKPLCVIGKGSYGKVYLVENRHYEKNNKKSNNGNSGNNKAGAASATRHNIVRETLNWMSNRHWRADNTPKAMGKEENCHRVYALKVLTKEMVKKKHQEHHTWTENEVLKHLKHPFIVNMHFAFKTRSKLFLCTEYCPGGELFYHLSKAGSFPLSTAKFYAACILSALEYVHSLGIVYRDLKPENVIMDEHGYVKLADFGLARTGVWDNHSVRSLCGTPEYLAPEVLTGSYGLSVDHWALAALIYEMLTGLPPFYSRCREELYEGIRKSTLEYPNYIDATTKDFLQKMFIKDPRNRLGCIDVKQIRQHPFFDDIDFDRLTRRELPPPFVPSINYDSDVSYIDNQFTDIVLDDFNSEEPLNPIHENPADNGGCGTDNFLGWYYDIRYPDHYFPDRMGPMRTQQ